MEKDTLWLSSVRKPLECLHYLWSKVQTLAGLGNGKFKILLIRAQLNLSINMECQLHVKTVRRVCVNQGKKFLALIPGILHFDNLYWQKILTQRSGCVLSLHEQSMNISLNKKIGLDGMQLPTVQDVFRPIPGLINCAGWLPDIVLKV